MPDTLAVVGAGAAGAATAYALRETDTAVTVFEKSGGVCGRAATRRRGDCTYDYGANYLRSDDERVARIVTEELDADGLVDVAEPVWTFDADGSIDEGEDRDGHKWSYERGLTQLAKRLFARTDAEVHRRTRVGSLSRTGQGWRVHADDGTDLGTFDAVLSTAPAPQTADVLEASEWDHPLREELVAAARAVPYRTIYSAVFHYDRALDRPWYALVNVDREHEVGWLSREECKPGHVPDGESLLVAQMAPDWSAARIDDDPGAVLADAAALTADLLDDDRLADPDWADHQGWRYALADDAVDAGPVEAAREHGLHVAGDWVAGEARVHAAVRSGLDAADRLAE
jgi:hypothetical protein